MNSLFSRTVGLLVIVVVCVWQAAAEEKQKPAKNDQPHTSAKPEFDSKKTMIGRHVPNFIRPGSDGKQIALSDFNDAKIVVGLLVWAHDRVCLTAEISPRSALSRCRA